MSEHSDLQVPSAAIYGCAGLTLSAVEESFFKAANPLGFILFARNCETPDQVRELVAALRGSVGRPDAPVLIDQEGGRAARLHAERQSDVEGHGLAGRVDVGRYRRIKKQKSKL